MAWTTPKTWTAGAKLLAAELNTHVRDNLNAINVGTTAGDVLYYTAAATPARLGIGADRILAGNAGGTAPAYRQGMLLIESKTSGYDITSIPQTYSNLRIVYQYVGEIAVGSNWFGGLLMLFNNDGGSNYSGRYFYNSSSTTVAMATMAPATSFQLPLYCEFTNSYPTMGVIDIANYTGSTNKLMTFSGVAQDGVAVTEHVTGSGVWTVTDAITRITLSSASGVSKTGTAWLYGY
jgi:hypothetical protein